jgi:hypothetical protein
MAEQGLPKVKKEAGDETADNWLKGEGTWPISEIDLKIIDPDGLFLPRDPREVQDAQQDRERGSKDLYQQKFKPPFGAVDNDWEDNIDPRAGSNPKATAVGDTGDKEGKGPVSKHAAADRSHGDDGERNYKGDATGRGSKSSIDITDEYMNKPPKANKLFPDDKKLSEMSVEELQKLLEAEESADPFFDDAGDDGDLGEDLLANLAPSDEGVIPDSEYDSAQDDEEAAALDTFEHSHQEPLPKEGTIEEILPVAAPTTPPMTEAISGDRGETDRFFGEQPGAIDKPAGAAYKAYLLWAGKKGIQPIVYQAFKRRHERQNGTSGGSLSSAGGGQAMPAPEPQPALQAEDLGADFSDMLSPLAKAKPEQLSQNLTADEKYAQLLGKVYDWATSPMEAYEKDASQKTSGSKRHMMICGSPGVGKTFSVKEAVLQAVKEGIDFKTQYVRGTIGKSISNVMAFLYRFRQGYLIIFDDCDDFLDSDLGSVMKGVFELDAPSTNTGSVGVRKMAAKNVLDLEDQPLEENAIHKYLRTDDFMMFEALGDGDYEDEDEDGIDTDGEDETQELLPARINFQSRILFISNKKRDRIDAAVRSRLSIVELYLTAEEIISRIREIFSQLLKNEKSVAKDRLEWAKTNALRWLELTVKANGRPIEFPGGRALQLPFDPENTIIEFRTYIDLVAGWLQQARKFEREHKGTNLMTTPKLPMDFLRGFLMGELVPILKDATAGSMRR